MKTVKEIIGLSTTYLQEKGVKEPRRQAEELLSDQLGVPRLELYVNFDRPLEEKELVVSRERLQRRGKGEPAAYIHGQVEFLGCDLKVTRDVLIPRSETELLADRIVKELKGQDLKGKQLWDVCCGSGCLGVSIKKQLPELEVILSDLSEAALKLVEENAKRNDVEVTLLQGDLLAPFGSEKTDYLVCNPPYVTESEYQELDHEVRDFEPRGALVSGNSGLEFYSRLKDGLPAAMNSGGKAWFELGTGQGSEVKDLFGGAPWSEVRVEQDWSGHDRFFFLAIQ